MIRDEEEARLRVSEERFYLIGIDRAYCTSGVEWSGVSRAYDGFDIGYTCCRRGYRYRNRAFQLE